jgi:hypothetical protein
MQKRLIQNLHIHLADANAQLEWVYQLGDTLHYRCRKNMPKSVEIISWRNDLFFNYYLEHWVLTWEPWQIRSKIVCKNP